MASSPIRPPPILDEDLSRALERIAAAQGTLIQAQGARSTPEDVVDRVARFLPYVLYIFDIRERRTLYLNRHTAAILGWTAEDIQRIGDDIVGHLLHPDEVARLPEIFARWDGAPDGTVLDSEYRLLAKGGEWRWCRSRDTIFARDPDGSVRLVLGTLEDVTDQRRLRERLAQAQSFEALGRLAGGLAHDFNNYLTAILGAVEGARAALGRGDSPERPLEEIAAACRAAGAMTQQLVQFALGRPTRPERVELAALLRELDTLLHGLLGPLVTLEVDAPSSGLAVWIERPLLVQVLVNLALNARDAMPAGGRLLIAVREENQPDPGLPPGPYVRIEVTDDGLGMDAETLAKVFQPFFTTKAERGGTGLGLATAWGIVTAAGGGIRAESEPGRGTSFFVALPCASCGEREPAREEGAGRAASGRLLLVEDEPELAELFADTLSELGLEVVREHDAVRALERLRADARSFDALVTDLTLPGGSGLVLARAFRECRPDGALVVVSGWAAPSALADEELPRDALFLSKPFAPEELRAAVEGRLGLARDGEG